jgi:prepilin-type processing-associated H-X9-DG protein
MRHRTIHCAARAFSRASAFSLVELLVVVGIVALVIALVLPALGAARESAKSVQCLSNLRQLATSAHQYAADNEGHYPIGYYSAVSPPYAYGHNWDFTLVLNQSTGQREVRPGLLWMGRGDAKVQQCPSFDGRSTTLMDPYSGYNYNVSYIGHGDLEVVKAPARVADVRSPARTALFGDGEWGSGANKFMRSPRLHPGDTFGARHTGTQGFRHRGATNVAFCDGHAETLRQRHTGGNKFVAEATGFLSEDNSMYDLQ